MAELKSLALLDYENRVHWILEYIKTTLHTPSLTDGFITNLTTN